GVRRSPTCSGSGWPHGVGERPASNLDWVTWAGIWQGGHAWGVLVAELELTCASGQGGPYPRWAAPRYLLCALPSLQETVIYERTGTSSFAGQMGPGSG